jgi:hypothetical protein
VLVFSIRAVICRIRKVVRIRRHIQKGYTDTELALKKRYGITKWGVSLNTGILFTEAYNKRKDKTQFFEIGNRA